MSAPDIHRHPIYSHAFIRRVELLKDVRTELRLDDGRLWIELAQRGGIRIYRRRGSMGANEMPPKGTTPMGSLNKRLGTRLRCLEAHVDSEGVVEMTFGGVRPSDIALFLDKELDLDVDGWKEIKAIRQERYMAFHPWEAQLIAEHFNHEGRSLGGAKRQLIHDVPIPTFDIEGKRKRIVRITLYRAQMGVTVAYRLEGVLSTRDNPQVVFREEDQAIIDRVLLDIVARVGVVPIPKPARWEPETDHFIGRNQKYAKLHRGIHTGSKLKPEDIVAVSPYIIDGALLLDPLDPLGPGNMQASGSRGGVPQDVSNHYLSPTDISLPSDVDSQSGVLRLSAEDRREWSLILDEDDAPVGGPCAQSPSKISTEDEDIRAVLDELDAEEQEDRSVLLLSESKWAPLVAELSQRPGMLSEVLLDAERDNEVALIQSIINAAPGRAAVATFGARPGPGGYVLDAPRAAYGLLGHSDWWAPCSLRIILVSPSVLACLDRDTERHGEGIYVERVHQVCMALYEWFESIRKYCEATGESFVFVTPSLLDRSIEGSVRSLLGDASSYHCHMRFLCVGKRWVAIKDMAEGRIGRLL